MERLNEDTRFDLFDTIAELVDDGVFILMSIRTDWQSQILRSPRLWRYITISDHTEDLEAKVRTQITISQGLPLVVRVHFPFSPLHVLEDVLANAIDCLMVVNPLIEHYHDRTFDILRKILLQYPLHQIACIMWRDSTGYRPYTPENVIKQICDCARLNNTERFERFLQEYPPSLLSYFSAGVDVDWYTPAKMTGLSVAASHLCFNRLTHLLSLTFDQGSYAGVNGEIANFGILPRIQNLHIKLSYHSQMTSLLVAPNLRQLTLYGSCGKIMTYLAQAEPLLQLEKLTLQPFGDDESIEPISKRYRNAHVPRHCTSELVIDMDYAWANLGYLDAMTVFVRLMTASVRETRLHIYIRSEYLIFLQHLQVKRRIDTIRVSGAHLPNVDGFPESQTTCETLILRDAKGNPQFKLLPRPQKLVFINTRFALSDIPSSWASALSMIQVDETWVRPRELENEYRRDFTPNGSPHLLFASLCLLKCEVRIAILAITSNHRFPVLEELHIRKGSSFGDKVINAFLVLLLSTVYVPNNMPIRSELPKMHTLALDWFPEWKRIHVFLEHWVEIHAANSMFTLKLPKRPATRLLSAIVRLLNGPSRDVALPGVIVYDETPECHGCALAGWRSEGDCEARHGKVSMTELFTITKNTYY